MLVVLGALAGLVLGFAIDDAETALGLAILGAIAGAIVGWWRRRKSPPVPDAALLVRRLEAVEARLAQIEHAMRIGATLPAESPVTAPPPAVPVTADRHTPPPRPSYGAVAPLEGTSPPAAAATVTEGPPGASHVPPSLPASPRPGALDGVRAWLAGGNTLTRVGIVVLFFGVAFLLRYFAEIVTVPIEAKLAGAALAGLALAALGVRLARGRPAYGLSLQGAGMGIVYLTVFAAFRLYPVLPPVPAIALLVVVAAGTVALALRHDSQALAGLAMAGGFMAPILIETGTPSPVPLFSWFAVLNAAVFAVAWRRAWRALNVLGFAFTFALGLAWGWSFYRPAHFAVVQPFLLLFFLFYVGIAILYAKRQPLDAKAPVDGVLVFGVPLVGFALQAGLARGFRYGEAISAVVLAGFYAVLWLAYRTRAEPGLARLARAFAALAVVFGTLAIPFAFDARWTTAGWALEAAAVYWLGTVQRQTLARAFAIGLAFVAAFAFVWDAPARGAVVFANAAFLAMAMIGLASLAIPYFADRRADAIGPRERRLMPWLFAWGTAWWLAAGMREIDHLLNGAREVNGMIAWAVGTGAAGLAASRLLQWPRAAWLFVVVLPALVAGGLALGDLDRTTLSGGGWIVWPLAWLVHAAGLRRVEAVPPGAGTLSRLRDLHAVTALAFVAWLAWEASEWTGRATADGTVWMACAAALPALLYLAMVTRWRGTPSWPLRDYGEAYGRRAGTLIAAALAVWFVAVNLVSPGDPHPLPYVPIATPLDVTLVAVLAVLWAWSGAWARMTPAARTTAAAAAAFLALNGALVRVAHHWGDVPWRLHALFAHRPLQVAFTLAWTVLALALMLVSTRRGLREGWIAGAALLAVVVAKLFLLDLAALSGLTRVVAFLGVGALLLVIGYVAPLPPARPGDRTG